MTLEFARQRQHSELPGRAVPYFLSAGGGDRAQLFDQLVTVLLSGQETEGQFGVFTLDGPRGDAIPAHSHADVHEIFYVLEGKVNVWIQDADGTVLNELLEPGDFGYVPAGLMHSFRIEQDSTKIFGVCTGGFERFFETAGTPTEATSVPEKPYVPSREQLAAAAEKFHQRFDFALRFDNEPPRHSHDHD